MEIKELTVIPYESIFSRMCKQLIRNRKGNYNRSSFIYRMNINSNESNELFEALLNARSSTSLEDLEIVAGRHGKLIGNKLVNSSFSHTNLQDIIKISPFDSGEKGDFDVLAPILLNSYCVDSIHYTLRYEYLNDEKSGELYKFIFDKKDSAITRPMLTGELYIDAHTLVPIAFDGSIENIQIQQIGGNKDSYAFSPFAPKIAFNIGFKTDSLSVNINHICVSFNYKDLTCKSFVLNADSSYLGYPSKPLRENLLDAIEHTKTRADLFSKEVFVFHTKEEDSVVDKMDNWAMNNNSMVSSTRLDSLSQRLRLFGERIPQEKVYVHLDNTSYFLGDTIWFAAYTRRTNNDHPSRISRVLYAELWNHDGYLVERKLIEMKHGRGSGFFELPDTLYGGFYELRAYTRWQLNWGQTEHPHKWTSELWFYSKAMAKEYYRDYDKLYSRVFPVYDKPKAPGEYYHDMTLRPLRRYFKDDAKPSELCLSLFPEGGNLVVGVPCRVAFEAATTEGEYQEGTLSLKKENEEWTMDNALGQHVSSVATINRGRGVFTFTPEAGRKYTAIFTAKDGRSIKATLPRAEEDGVALSVDREGDTYTIKVHAQGKPARQPLGMTIMHEGVLKHFEEIGTNSSSATQVRFTPASGREGTSSGVHQVTVFDADGHIHADRLFFVTDTALSAPTLAITGIKEQYAPFEAIDLQVAATSMSERTEGEPAHISLAVRDAAHSDNTFDSGNILTEMLLASEIKGFVPHPGYFFEKDDKEHRMALDLLMMTQGWRRFNWQEMAVEGAFELTEPAELTQVLKGYVMHYQTAIKENELQEGDMAMGLFKTIVERAAFDRSLPNENENTYEYKMIQDAFKEVATDNLTGNSTSAKQKKWLQFMNELDNFSKSNPGPHEISSLQNQSFESAVEGHKHNSIMIPKGRREMLPEWIRQTKLVKQSICIHAEFVQEGFAPAEQDITTQDGTFCLNAPYFVGQCFFFLGGSDPKKWGARVPSWIDTDECHYPEYYIRISWPNPRFAHPYSYYQNHLCESLVSDSAIMKDMSDSTIMKDNGTLLRPISIRTRHGGLRNFDSSQPAIVLDAYKVFNDVCDAGLSTSWYAGQSSFIPQIARNYIGDMNMGRPYSIENRYESKSISFFKSFKNLDAYNYLYNLDKVYIYTDYSPRNEGDERFTQANQPTVTVDLRRLPDEGRRVTYRDRRYVLDGFACQEDFYHPDYRRNPPAEGQKDYRRTLYWNPDLQLDAEGKAHVTLYNNSQTTVVSVEAEGQTKDGTLLYTK